MARGEKPREPLSRDIWVAQFGIEAERLWPEVAKRHAATVALARSTGALHTDPAKAAAEWIAEVKPK